MAIELVAGGATALILPEWGGRLHQLAVPFAGGAEPLLVAPADPASYARRPDFGGSFPMAPWPNRIRAGRFPWAGREVVVEGGLGAEHAPHGTVLTERWQVVARTTRVCELTCDLGPGWPWEGRAWQRYELTGESLRMKLEVRSAREAFPAGCGWHPWFRRQVAGAADVRLRLPATRRYVLRDHLPTGEAIAPAGEFDLRDALIGQRALDDCYAGLTGPVVLEWGRLSLSMTISAPFPHVMVYATPEALCVEPQSCAPDAFNLAAAGAFDDGTAIARPGAAAAIESAWTWHVGP